MPLYKKSLDSLQSRERELLLEALLPLAQERSFLLKLIKKYAGKLVNLQQLVILSLSDLYLYCSRSCGVVGMSPAFHTNSPVSNPAKPFDLKL